MEKRRPHRIALYGHDTFGLGHLRRNLALAGQLVKDIEGSSLLLITGSPMADAFSIPPHVDVLRLPSVTKDENGCYRARHLSLPIEEIQELRSRLVREALVGYRPDLLIVDHAPAGMNGELRDLLYELRTTSHDLRMVLGLRDIIDHPEAVRKQWQHDRVYPLLEHVYDEVWVYGCDGIGPSPREYGLNGQAHYVGYLAKRNAVGYSTGSAAGMATEKRQDGTRVRGPGTVLVTSGGGEDGYSVLSHTLDALLDLGDRAPRANIVGGPFLSDDLCNRLRQKARSVPRARFHRFLPGLAPLLREADAVVTMGGYNALCDVLEWKLPAVVIPRTEPRVEQQIRARAFAKLNLVETLDLKDATPARLGKTLLGLLEPGKKQAVRSAIENLNLDGLAEVGRRARMLLGTASEAGLA